MSKKGFKKRLFVSIFSFYFIIFQFFMVPSAMAFPNFDLFGAGWDPIQKILELIKEAGQGAMKTSISTALSYFLQTMAKDVAQGIVSGSTGQEPLFRVETFTTSLKNAADNATGVFLDDLSERGFDTLGLCKPVSVQSISSAEGDLTKWLADVMKDLTDSLNLIPDFGEYDLTSRTPTCTVSKVIETMQDNIDYILGSYFEYLFLDVFKKNCNISEIERFENDFSKAVTSLMGFTFSVLDPFSIIPEAEDLAGALESLEKEYDFQCSFFVCEDGNTNYNCENINWEKTSEKMISETIYPVIVNSLQLAFGEYDIVETPEQTLEFQVARSCYEMADVIDDNILLSMADPKNLSDSIDDLTNTYNINLFNNVVSVMNPYYIHSDINYLDHFKKCVYLANKGETGPSFIEADSDSVKEENCWLGIYKNNNNIEYNGKVIPKINITEEYKKEIK
ncbi:hypothetical protein EOM09_03380, partial [bacterium]|nr:hypothetical protein [bacterium]